MASECISCHFKNQIEDVHFSSAELCEPTTMSLELRLFRHGQTNWNTLGLYQGWHDSELSDLGRDQTQTIVERASACGPVALYSSDLERCKQAAAGIALTTGLAPVFDERLRERNFGAWTGCTRSEVRERFPDQFEQWSRNDPDSRPHDGESLNDVIARAQSFLYDIAGLAKARVEDSENKIYVGITHGAWISSVVQHVLGVVGQPRRFGAPMNGSMTVIRFHDDTETWRLESFNDRV